VLTLTLVVALGQVARSAALAAMERQSGRNTTLEISETQVVPYGIDRAELRAHLTRRVLALGANAASAEELVSASVDLGARRIPVDIVGIDPSFASIRRLRVVAGRWLAATDAAYWAPVLAVNRVLAGEAGCVLVTPADCRIVLDLDEKIAGRVIGVVDDGEQTSRAYVPVSMVDRWASAQESATLRVIAWVSPDLTAGLPAMLKTGAVRGGAHAEVQRLDDPQTVDQTIAMIEFVLGGMALLALLTGELGILNLGLVSVRARSREFALRRAFGASRNQIFAAVLFESVVTASMGGVLGVLLASVAVASAPLVVGPVMDPSDLPPFPVGAAIVGFLASAGLGVLAGTAPAYWAMRSTIIAAIRD
jgi:putative ABC transport system permease protein